MNRLWIIVCLSLLLPSPLIAWEADGVAVTDGDSITILYENRRMDIELAGVDCPELDQPWGKQAQQLTSYLILGKRILIWPIRRDEKERIVSFVFSEEINVNKALLRTGLAWHDRTTFDDSLLKALEMEARIAEKGLWSDPNPIPPWEFRKQRSLPDSGS